MKFVFAVVMLALAAGVQSSLIGAHAPGVSYVTSALHGPVGAWGGPWGGPAVVGHGLWGGPAAVAVDHGAWGGPWGGAWGDNGAWGAHGAWGGHPGISLSQGPDHGHGHGVYVAKTRGAIHTAPLAGHIASATSLNVAAAPGTH